MPRTPTYAWVVVCGLFMDPVTDAPTVERRTYKNTTQSGALRRAVRYWEKRPGFRQVDVVGVVEPGAAEPIWCNGFGMDVPADTHPAFLPAPGRA